MLKINVKNLGKIKSASVELAPLVILVGRNNTGKSYLATLIWALGQLETLGVVGGSGRKPGWIKEFLAPLTKGEERRVGVTPKMATQVKQVIDREIAKNAPMFLNDVFAFDGFESSTFSIESDFFAPFELVMKDNGEGAVRKGASAVATISVVTNDSEILIFRVPHAYLSPYRQWLRDYLFYEIAGFVIFGRAWRAYSRQNYIPAARTGIMLALPSLVSNALEADSDEQSIKLPRPLRSFLERMTRPSPSRKDEFSIASQINKKLIKGKITKPNEAVAEFFYTPDGTSLSLPLHATSSMITELVPLQLALERHAGTQHLVFEEPEAHLHLDAQRHMATLIARLISAGNRVTLTTHSDTFVQQINNLMVLHDHPHRAALMDRFGYTTDDLINPNSVRAYEFCQDGDVTFVKEATSSKDGFAIQTLNDTLYSLATETIALNQA